MAVVTVEVGALIEMIPCVSECHALIITKLPQFDVDVACLASKLRERIGS